MKTQFLLLFSVLALFTNCKSKKNSENAKVSIELTVSRDYCGGAAPNEEMLKELTDSKPYVDGIFYLVFWSYGTRIGDLFIINTIILYSFHMVFFIFYFKK